jgi:hypothetical protein
MGDECVVEIAGDATHAHMRQNHTALHSAEPARYIRRFDNHTESGGAPWKTLQFKPLPTCGLSGLI